MKVSIVLVFSIFWFGFSDGFEYHVGVGIADMTGPAAEVGMVRKQNKPILFLTQFGFQLVTFLDTNSSNFLLSFQHRSLAQEYLKNFEGGTWGCEKV